MMNQRKEVLGYNALQLFFGFGIASTILGFETPTPFDGFFTFIGIMSMVAAVIFFFLFRMRCNDRRDFFNAKFGAEPPRLDASFVARVLFYRHFVFPYFEQLTEKYNKIRGHARYDEPIESEALQTQLKVAREANRALAKIAQYYGFKVILNYTDKNTVMHLGHDNDLPAMHLKFA